MADKNPLYFTEKEEHKIVEAIRDAENMTSGEIRVHISKNPDNGGLDAAKKVFADLHMHNTKYHNGVLLHISTGSKTFSIYGDEGIDKVVPDNFWESTRDIMQKHFADGNIVEGIRAGIQNVGVIMKEHFPLDVDDKNELSDEITYD
ncbi:TPM domain-containing protein [Flavobacteriaceae bacterium Ap0902]|nr:TPM domain-containing protein [Flavobacteriaceae bacterium Ap0902]